MTSTNVAPRARRRGWLVPAGLILLSFVPVAAGSDRLAQLSRGGPVTPENARFFAEPIPVVVHIVGATLFAILGALQFWAAFRRSRPGWHRVAGRIAVPSGLAVAVSGLWMTLFYPRPPGDGELLEAFRLVFGTAMLTAIVLGFVAIRRRDIRAHRAWMTRGYAIGMGAGTQVVTTVPWILAAGTPSTFVRAMLMLAGWLINVAVAEWIIRRPRSRTADAPVPARPRVAVPVRSTP
jgi:uncharacterized membrane protein